MRRKLSRKALFFYKFAQNTPLNSANITSTFCIWVIKELFSQKHNLFKTDGIFWPSSGFYNIEEESINAAFIDSSSIL